MRNFILQDFQQNLLALKDESYHAYISKLLPNVDEKIIIGIRTANLRGFAKKYFVDKDVADFLKILPHDYHEENLLHAYFISAMKAFDECLAAVKNFLPFVDNWGVCDSLTPKIFASHTAKLEPEILTQLSSSQPYNVRFAFITLMKFYLDENFSDKYLAAAAKVQSENYYVQMAAAWFFAEALAKQYDSTLPYFVNKKISTPIRKKAIQKALESRKFSAEQKNFLRTLRPN